MTFDPQNMASRLTFNHFDSDFCVPWSICNQKLPDKLSWYEFDVFTGRSSMYIGHSPELYLLLISPLTLIRTHV